MADNIILYWPEYADMAENIAGAARIRSESIDYRTFPDGECYVKIPGGIKDHAVWLLGSLFPANERIIALRLISETLKESGAGKIRLISPYLPYMRQDKAFRPGEAVSTGIIPGIIETGLDELITVDPHLHRIHDLADIYRCRTKVLHSAGLIGSWIKSNIKDPVLIGPDSESRQWVGALANTVGKDYVVLKKERRGDFNVSISDEGLDALGSATPVLIDDIISSGTTMIQAARVLREKTGRSCIAVGIHGIFASNAVEKMLKSGIEKIITTNSIIHPTNRIDLSSLIADMILSEIGDKSD